MDKVIIVLIGVIICLVGWIFIDIEEKKRKKTEEKNLQELENQIKKDNEKNAERYKENQKLNTGDSVADFNNSIELLRKYSQSN